MTRIRTLPATRHAVFRIAPGLLLVFKPRGHREAEHAHPHRQRLHVLRGKLEVRIGRRRVTLPAGSRPLLVAAERAHETRAVQNTWLLAEIPSPARSAARGKARMGVRYRRRPPS